MILVTIGVVLVAFLFIGRDTDSTATNSGDPKGFNVLEVGAEREQAADEAAVDPEDKILTYTVPKMARVESAAVPDATGDDEGTLGENAAILLPRDFPGRRRLTCTWRITALATRTPRASWPFWDLDVLEDGDEVLIEDADGGRILTGASRSSS